jgi:plasmid stabilization system protein ParE
LDRSRQPTTRGDDRPRLAARQLGAFAQSSSVSAVPRYEQQGVRRRVHHPYLIFYRIDASAFYVLRILHGSRDYEALIFPTDQT